MNPCSLPFLERRKQQKSNGRSSDSSPRTNAFPTARASRQWHHVGPKKDEIQQRDCPGFSPDSLLIICHEPIAFAKVALFSQLPAFFPRFFCLCCQTGLGIHRHSPALSVRQRLSLEWFRMGYDRQLGGSCEMESIDTRLQERRQSWSTNSVRIQEWRRSWSIDSIYFHVRT